MQPRTRAGSPANSLRLSISARFLRCLAGIFDVGVAAARVVISVRPGTLDDLFNALGIDLCLFDDYF